jgi:HK97 family phage portal protein
MKLFAANVPSDVSPTSDYWYTPFGPTSTYTGKTVSDVTAMNVSAFYAGVRLISETMGMLPVFIYRRLGGSAKEKFPEHPLFDILHTKPNEWQDALQWHEMMTSHAIMWGNGYSEIVPGRRGPVDQLIPLNPKRMMEVRLEADGKLRYVYMLQNGEKKTYFQNEIFHLKGFGYGLAGISLLTAMQETLGIALGTEEHAGRYFGNAAVPSGIVEHPGTMSGQAQDNFKKGFNEDYASVSRHHTVMVLEEGMTWKQMTVSNKDSQFLESRKYHVNDIARWLRLPPHLIGDLEKATFDNITEQDLEFVKYAMLPWVKRYEQAHQTQLFMAPKTFFAEYNLEALLRADYKTRMDGHQIAITNGILSRNEVRELENRNPYAGGDQFLTPLNMTTTTTGGAQQLKEPEPLEVPLELPSRAESIVRTAAMRVVRKEIAFIEKQADRRADDKTGWEKSIRRFYNGHVGYVEETLSYPEPRARRYCAQQMGEVLFEGPKVIETWGEKRTEELAALALQGE